MIPIPPERDFGPYYDRVCEHGKRLDVHCRECQIRGYCGCPLCRRRHGSLCGLREAEVGVWVLVSAFDVVREGLRDTSNALVPNTMTETAFKGLAALDSIEAENKRLKRQIENVREAVNDLHNAGSDPAVLRVIESALARIPESKES